MVRHAGCGERVCAVKFPVTGNNKENSHFATPAHRQNSSDLQGILADSPTNADLKRILENDPENETDPLMMSYLRDDAIGALKRERGRKKQSPQPWLQTSALSILAPSRAEEICKEREANRKGIDRYDLSPTKQAAEDYARAWKLGSGPLLLNRISAHRNVHLISVSEKRVEM